MLTIKAKKGKHGEIRRASIPVPATFAEFQTKMSELFGPFAPDFKLKFEDEEGDLVTLGNQSDFEEALRVVAGAEPHILRVTVLQARTDAERAARHTERAAQEPPAPHAHHGHRGGNSWRAQRARAAGCPAFQDAPPAAAEEAHSCGGGFGGLPAALGPIMELLKTAKASLPDLLNNPALRNMAEGLLQSNVLKIVQPFVCDACNANIAGDRFHSTVQPDFDLCKACFEAPTGVELNKTHAFVKVTALEALVQTLQGGGTFDAFFAPGAAAPEPVARHHAICDRCNQGIAGIRHRCVDCADYDECNVCHLREGVEPHAAGHVFHAIEDPAVRAVPDEVKAARAAQLEAAKQEAARKEAEERARQLREAEAAAAAAREAEAAAAAARAEAEQKARQAALLVPLVPVAPAEPVSVTANEPSSFERNLATLESMGFTDRKRNITVLVRNRNKLFESIQELLA